MTFTSKAKHSEKDPDVDDLLRKLDRLRSLTQASFDSSKFTKLIKRLAKKSCLSNKSDQISLATTSCIAEILRLSAPNPPYKEQELMLIFKAFNRVISHCSNPRSPHFLAFIDFLRTLSLSQSMVLITDLPESQTLIFSFVQEVFKSVSSSSHKERDALYTTILVSVLSELSSFSDKLIGSLLSTLATLSEVSSNATTMLTTALRASAETMAQPIYKFLAPYFTTELQHKYDEKSLHRFHEILGPLWNISPEYVTNLNSLLIQEFVSESSQSRELAMDAVFCILKQDQILANFTATHPHSYSAFLACSYDTSANVKTKFAAHCLNLIKMQGLKSDPKLLSSLCLVLLDVDASVRRIACKYLVEYQNDMNIIRAIAKSPETYEIVSDRCRDKDSETRVMAVSFLTSAYNLVQSNNEASGSQMPSTFRKFPCTFLSLYLVEDDILTTCLDLLLYTKLITITKEPQQVVDRACRFVSTLTEESFEIFVAITITRRLQYAHALQQQDVEKIESLMPELISSLEKKDADIIRGISDSKRSLSYIIEQRDSLRNRDNYSSEAQKLIENIVNRAAAFLYNASTIKILIQSMKNEYSNPARKIVENLSNHSLSDLEEFVPCFEELIISQACIHQSLIILKQILSNSIEPQGVLSERFSDYMIEQFHSLEDPIVTGHFAFLILKAGKPTGISAIHKYLGNGPIDFVNDEFSQEKLAILTELLRHHANTDFTQIDVCIDNIIDMLTHSSHKVTDREDLVVDLKQDIRTLSSNIAVLILGIRFVAAYVESQSNSPDNSTRVRKGINVLRDLITQKKELPEVSDIKYLARLRWEATECTLNLCANPKTRTLFTNIGRSGLHNAARDYVSSIRVMFCDAVDRKIWSGNLSSRYLLLLFLCPHERVSQIAITKEKIIKGRHEKLAEYGRLDFEMVLPRLIAFLAGQFDKHSGLLNEYNPTQANPSLKRYIDVYVPYLMGYFVLVTNDRNAPYLHSILEELNTGYCLTTNSSSCLSVTFMTSLAAEVFYFVLNTLIPASKFIKSECPCKIPKDALKKKERNDTRWIGTEFISLQQLQFSFENIQGPLRSGSPASKSLKRQAKLTKSSTKNKKRAMGKENIPTKRSLESMQPSRRSARQHNVISYAVDDVDDMHEFDD
ncbi:hypothetical protein CANCADRAFT_109263 [Tortispora caseinolytica NRRL Y-17796]|uniref:Sister chromatid cohesion protein n=1 Tax=Tortispora caseinolytica NRRL Y-17796 TaxID=767744 RepID=A0A1E4TG77_9ASCO|nr:hypothetical protein CANCADRAFT_109263 [Tortispora caseinolytica NRRL Y-17796]